MANKTTAAISAADALSEILIPTEGDSVFSKYRDKELIGRAIFSDMYNHTYTQKKGFKMADGAREIGILSQCQSLQAILLLASEFGLKFDVKYSSRENALTIRELMDEVIEDLLSNKIKRDDEGRFVFDASPYDTEQFTAEYSNIDAIRWVIPTFLLVLKYHAKIHEICKWENELIEVIRYGLNYINEAFIGDPDSKGSGEDKLTFGWNFTKDCQEPSLYFTFAVCECYLEFFKTFEAYLTYQDANRLYETSGHLIPVSEDISSWRSKLLEEYERRKDLPDPGLTEEGKQRARYDEENELIRLFKAINKRDDALDPDGIDATLYRELEKRCKLVSHEIWRLVKNDFSDSFFYNDLRTKVNQEDIRMSTTSDVLFNSVYIINCLVDSGLDEDFLNSQQIALAKGDNKAASAYLREYNEMLETCQLASQRALRSYELLKKEGKEYIVDQFLIGFNERFDTHADLIKELRKLRMRVFSLLPLLIRTNNVISEYLVRYPQATMSKYLGYIMENRRADSKSSKLTWIWESDGFFSASNYYYVAALGQFYAYYEKYEKTYIEIDQNNEEDKSAIKAAHLAELESTGKIAELNRSLEDLRVELRAVTQEKDSEIARLRSVIDNQKSPIEDAVREIVQESLSARFPELFCEYFTRAAASYTEMTYKVEEKGSSLSSREMTPEYKEAKELKMALYDFLLALGSRSVHFANTRRSDSEKLTKKEMMSSITTETDSRIGEYVTEITSGTNGENK